MRNNIVQGSDSSEAEVFDLIKRIEKGLEKFGTNHRLILGGESYLTDKEISERLKVHRRTLQEYRSSGKLPYYMICGKCCTGSRRSKSCSGIRITERMIRRCCNTGTRRRAV